MKKYIYILSTLCFLTVLDVKAQQADRRQNLEFGIKAGFNVSNVWDGQGEDFVADSKLGLIGGAFFGIPIGKFLGVQPEVLFSQKGFKGSGILLGFPYSFTRTTTYLDLPLQIQLKPAEFLTFVGGPQFSYLINQKDSYTFGSNSSEQEEQFTNDNIRKNILGFVVGTDLIFSRCVVSARAGWDFQKNNGDGSSSTPRYKNRWLQLTFGIKL